MCKNKILGQNLVPEPPNQMEETEPRPRRQLRQPRQPARPVGRRFGPLQLPAARPSSRPLESRRLLLPAAPVVLPVFGGCRQRRPTLASRTCRQPCIAAVSARHAARPSPSVRRGEFAATVVGPFRLSAFTIFPFKLIICLLL